jgi:hypothetical protein
VSTNYAGHILASSLAARGDSALEAKRLKLFEKYELRLYPGTGILYYIDSFYMEFSMGGKWTIRNTGGHETVNFMKRWEMSGILKIGFFLH